MAEAPPLGSVPATANRFGSSSRKNSAFALNACPPVSRPAGDLSFPPCTHTLSKCADHSPEHGRRAIWAFRRKLDGVLSWRDISAQMARIHAISLSLSTRQCPLCGSEDVLRSSRRGVLEWTVLLLFLLRPFRCRQCSARHVTFFFRRRKAKIAHPVIPEPTED